MNCILRSWPKRSKESNEIILKAIPVLLREEGGRVPSFSKRVAPTAEPLRIVLSEIVCAESICEEQIVQLTTISQGFWEFYCTSRNAMDVLWAFLKSTLSQNQILERGPTLNSNSSATSSLCMDVDALNTKHFKKPEQWSQSLSRRLGRLTQSMSDISGSFCDFTCCGKKENEVGSKARYEFNLEMHDDEENEQSDPKLEVATSGSSIVH